MLIVMDSQSGLDIKDSIGEMILNGVADKSKEDATVNRKSILNCLFSNWKLKFWIKSCSLDFAVLVVRLLQKIGRNQNWFWFRFNWSRKTQSLKHFGWSRKWLLISIWIFFRVETTTIDYCFDRECLQLRFISRKQYCLRVKWLYLDYWNRK